MAFHADVSDTALQKLIDGLALSIRQPGGSILTSYKDGAGEDIDAAVPSAKQAALGKATEFKLEVTVNPDGASAYAKVICKSPVGCYSVEGNVDVAVLATKLV